MKKEILLVSAAAVFIGAFSGAAWWYKKQQSGQVNEAQMARLLLPEAVSYGDPQAKVTLVEFFDPACETCAVFYPYVKEIMARYPGKVRLVIRYAPLHPGSDEIVALLEAARLQGKFKETLETLFSTQAQWASHHKPQPEMIWELLAGLGMDAEQLRMDQNSFAIKSRVLRDMADAKAAGVRATPEFFVNGRILQDFGREQLLRLVAEEIDRQY